jgi:hypothetical protein
MMKFKEDGIGVEDLLKLIPEELLLDLAKETNVDYQVKKLYGRNVFNLLLYALVEKERIGLRGLEDLYGSRTFKTIFNLPASTKSAKYNSFSARLAKMNVRFFEQAYESVYDQCSQLYDESVLSLKYKITRVDSTMVCQSACKLEQGINVGEKKDGKKQIKYTIGLTNMFPSSVEVFTEQCHNNENLTIPKAILKVLDKHQDNVFVFDRGVSKRSVYCELDDRDCSFVTRLNVGARHVVLEDFPLPENRLVNNLTVEKDLRVNLYKTGEHAVDHPFRLIQAQNEKGLSFWFLTNRFDLTIEEVILIYKKRWDIEVFFRFLKQELNFSHLMSVNENGIKIILYMTLIASMMILIYKRINDFGYKTAKRRFSIELDDIRFDEMKAMVIKIVNPNTVFR